MSLRREEFLGLTREVRGNAMSDAEFDWLFERGPLEGIVSLAEDEGCVTGVLAMTLARAIVDGHETRVAFSVHGTTHPAARGRGVFSRLELQNEERAAEQGATIALAFAGGATSSIFARLGWQDLYRARIWARPLRPFRALRRRGGGGLPPARGSTLERFTEAHEHAWRTEQPLWGSCLARDAEYLNWRYVESPTEYRLLASGNGYAVLTHVVRRGISTAAVCDLVGSPSEQRALLGRCLHDVRGGADVVIGIPAPDQRRAFAGRGFVTTPKALRVMGKALQPGVSLPTRWHFALGDTDFF